MTLADPPTSRPPQAELDSIDTPPETPLQRHNVIQADQFCPCGYNLHSQRIERDERLGFHVVRCPECGRYQPAGHGSTAMRPWLGRLAMGLIILWILFLLLVSVAAVGAFTGFAFTGIDIQTQWVQIDGNTGRPVASTWDPGTQTSIVKFADTGEVTSQSIQWEQRRYPRHHRFAVAYREHGGWGDYGMSTLGYVFFYASLSLLALFLGVAQSAALWHVRGWKRWLPMTVVLLLPIAFVTMTMVDGGYQEVSGLALTVAAIHLGLAALSWCAGILIGRSIVRFVVSLLVPPRPRQMLAFLWHADGKELPSAGHAPHSANR